MTLTLTHHGDTLCVSHPSSQRTLAEVIEMFEELLRKAEFNVPSGSIVYDPDGDRGK